MMGPIFRPPGNAQFQRRVAVFPAVKQRRQYQSNLWFFDSPKINRRFSVVGDVAFMHLVLLEGDLTVKSYDPQPPPVYATVNGETRQTKLHAHVNFFDGHTEWWEFKRAQDHGPARTGRAKPQLEVEAQAASGAGVTYLVKTDTDLLHQQIRFENWLNLTACINRCRNLTTHIEAAVLRERLTLHRAVAVHSLLNADGIDQAQMLAVIAMALQSGLITTELDKSLFGRASVLTWREK